MPFMHRGSHISFSSPSFLFIQAILQATEEARNVACRVKGRVSEVENERERGELSGSSNEMHASLPFSYSTAQPPVIERSTLVTFTPSTFPAHCQSTLTHSYFLPPPLFLFSSHSGGTGGLQQHRRTLAFLPQKGCLPDNRTKYVHESGRRKGSRSLKSTM